MICKYGAMVKASAAGTRKCPFKRHLGRKIADRGKPATVMEPTHPTGGLAATFPAGRPVSGGYQFWGTIELESWEDTTRSAEGWGAPGRSNSMRRSNAVERIIG